MNHKQLFNELETEIQQAYTDSITIDAAEKLAAKALHAQIVISRELQKCDLDSRMRKSGLKAVRAAVYLDEVSKADKKPTESALEHMLNINELVTKEQDGFDRSDAEKEELQRCYNILKDAHIYFRNIGRGKFE